MRFLRLAARRESAHSLQSDYSGSFLKVKKLAKRFRSRRREGSQALAILAHAREVRSPSLPPEPVAFSGGSAPLRVKNPEGQAFPLSAKPSWVRETPRRRRRVSLVAHGRWASPPTVSCSPQFSALWRQGGKALPQFVSKALHLSIAADNDSVKRASTRRISQSADAPILFAGARVTAIIKAGAGGCGTFILGKAKWARVRGE